MSWFPVKSIWKNARLRISSAKLKAAMSPEGLEAWSCFYLEEEAPESSYESISTANDAFFELLTKHGPPDVGNPWAQGEESHYLIHPRGFLATEFTRALSCDDSAVSDAKRENAKTRIGLLLQAGCEFISIQGAMPKDDSEFAATLALAEGSWELEGARHSIVIPAAVRLRLIPPAIAPGLLIGRIFLEDDKYPAPWRVAIDCLIKWRDKAFKKRPPKIDVSDFRDRRKALLKKQEEAGNGGVEGEPCGGVVSASAEKTEKGNPGI